ncbi:hypothetical protein [Sphingobacterium gobiense]|uniref:Uncharacterized protein n=1 Tax=Sphingobacterium gobiense TaxID=1382456 RepID=A0A2S9JD27_9SPHI|nr:hypothetical protein [Sphingobacterium gobiense]PRD50769.1 hypothetical protein C5749_18925 [Sphingobacterium gobiense]
MMKRTLLFVALSILFFACEKEEKTAGEWSKLAEEKRQDIERLIASTTCHDISEWSVFTHGDPYGCAPTHFPMHPSIKDEFDRLWADYLYFNREHTNAMIKEGVIIEPCWDEGWFHHAPIRLACRDNKASLVYIHDLEIEESKEQIAEIYPHIEAYLAELTCENNEGWTYTVLYNNDCSLSYIPVKRTNERSAIRTDIEFYNAHRANIVNKEKLDCSDRSYEYPDGIICEDGKPVVKTKTY